MKKWCQKGLVFLAAALREMKNRYRFTGAGASLKCLYLPSSVPV
jgi:hypothetical protein